MRRRIKVEYKRMRRPVWGLAYPEQHLIIIDDRAVGKKKLEILVHEAAHVLLPEKDEKEIVRISVAMTKMLWDEGFRCIDNTNIEPMQDGSIK